MNKSAEKSFIQQPTALVGDPSLGGRQLTRNMRSLCKPYDDLSEISPDASPPGTIVSELASHPCAGTVLRVRARLTYPPTKTEEGYWLGSVSHGEHDNVYVLHGELVTVVNTDVDVAPFEAGDFNVYRLLVMTSKGMGWGWSDAFVTVD